MKLRSMVFMIVAAPTMAHAQWAYPPARMSTQTDDYHGTAVADPYRWLESDGAETEAWIAAQNRLTQSYLQASPLRAQIRQQLAGVWNYARMGTPVREGGRLFFRKNDGLQNQAPLYVQAPDATTATVLLDPNKLASDGTAALQAWTPSRDGQKLAYQIAHAGSDWVTIRVRNVDSGRDLPDELHWAKHTQLAWDLDGTGFYYSRYDAPPPGAELTAKNEFQKLCWHQLGTPQSADVVVLERKDQPLWGWGAEVSDDGRYLVVSVWRGADGKNAVFYRELDGRGRLQPKRPVVELVANFDHEWAWLGNHGPVLWFRTDQGAPRSRVVAIDLRQPKQVRELIAEGPDTMDRVATVGARFVVVALHDATHRVRVHRLDGTFEREIPLPDLGTVGGFGGHLNDRDVYFDFQGFLQPTSVYRWDFARNERSLVFAPKLPVATDDFETEQVRVPASDGAQVPVFVVHRKGLKCNGSHPLLLYGYGGFNVSVLPSFSPAVLVWLQLGGVYAVATLRGGGEYGAAWHEAGMREHKQRVFDDFAEAGSWLVAQGYTSRQRLAIAGGSNGGLLVGASITQHPEWYAAALPAVGVMDMLRFHKFTVGWAWVGEYGSADDPKQFDFLRKYSPLHNVRPARYPAVLVTTADHDDRVVPAHSFKFTAALQKAQQGPAPVLIRVDTKAGHGAGKPTAKLIDEAADKWTFLCRALGLQPSLPPTPQPETTQPQATQPQTTQPKSQLGRTP